MSDRADFWARRRAGVAAEAKAEVAAEAAAVEEEALLKEQAKLEDMSEAEMLVALDLPDPDTLTKGDDFSVFMAKAVPDQIRRRALRTLWRSNPVLANVDMLVDYGEDFTDAAMAVENIQTAYQVGKGMLKHVEEMARQAEERANQPEPEEIEPEEEHVVEDEMILADDGLVADHEPTKIAYVSAQDDEADYAPPSPRRMKFRIEDAA